jgi:hypothetical protein
MLLLISPCGWESREGFGSFWRRKSWKESIGTEHQGAWVTLQASQKFYSHTHAHAKLRGITCPSPPGSCKSPSHKYSAKAYYVQRRPCGMGWFSVKGFGRGHRANCWQSGWNSIQSNSIQLNSIQFNSTQLNSTQFNSTQFNKWLDSSKKQNPGCLEV